MIYIKKKHTPYRKKIFIKFQFCYFGNGNIAKLIFYLLLYFDDANLIAIQESEFIHI